MMSVAVTVVTDSHRSPEVQTQREGGGEDDGMGVNGSGGNSGEGGGSGNGSSGRCGRCGDGDRWARVADYRADAALMTR